MKIKSARRYSKILKYRSVASPIGLAISQPAKIIVVLGPTASGKSELAVKIAKKFNGEIISADSRQVYKGLDIGSGKVPILYEPRLWRDESTESSIPPLQRKGGITMYYKGVRHRLLDVASPKKIFTVSQYQKLGQKAIKDILKRKKVPIICGGTGLYIDSLIYGYKFPEVPPSPELRKKLEKLSTEKLFEKLQKLDPQRANNIDKHNRRRLIRALEIVLLTKRPVAILQQARDKKTLYDFLIIGIKKSTEELKNLIHKRLKSRLKIGMVEEVRKLHEQGLSWKRLDDLGLEYRYISRYLRGLITKKEMGNLIEKESLKYAKRQMTWFQREKNVKWIEKAKEAMLETEKFLVN